jgi:Leucine-rich repeat (LRR) protein
MIKSFLVALFTFLMFHSSSVATVVKSSCEEQHFLEVRLTKLTSTLKLYENKVLETSSTTSPSQKLCLNGKQFRDLPENVYANVSIELFGQVEDLKKLHSFACLRELDLSQLRVKNENFFQPVFDILSLEQLNLSGLKITNVSFQNLSALINLHTLDVSSTLLFPNSVPYINSLTNLISLNLSHTHIDDDSLQALNLPKLEYLNVGHTLVTVEGIANFKNKLTTSQFLNISAICPKCSL